ncbi:MAG: glycerate kinase [Candidatus Schekmanbacteria bacterium]|nr:glycerate kinase [Candidatus Schekmanbacteria bacterium]
MKILIAPNSFKGTLSGPDACAAMREGVQRAQPRAEITTLPMSDGGEGFLDCLVSAQGGEVHAHPAVDPRGREIRARLGMIERGAVAVVEMAEASGLALVAPAERDPCAASTLGTGLLLLAALALGARRIVVGIGGSATVDCGMGIAVALGARFLDALGKPLRPSGSAMAKVCAIDTAGLDPRLRDVTVTAACDVRNPLVGPEGAARVFAPQKGAGEADVARLEWGLENLARLVARDVGVHIAALPRGGAGGGAAAGLAAFAGAMLRDGAELAMQSCGFDDHSRSADLVLTGEGRLDHQSLAGKLPVAVARRARGLDPAVPVIAICGSLEEGFAALADCPFSACFGLTDSAAPGPSAAAGAAHRLADCTEQVLRAIDIGRRLESARGGTRA